MHHPSLTTALVSQYVAKISTSLFAGAATYVSLVEHPARLQCGTRLAATQWVPSYKRAARLQGSLAVIASISSGVAYYSYNYHPKWLLAGSLMFLIVPYTFLALMKINRRLLDPEIDRDSDATKSLLETWGYGHLVRTVTSFLAMLIALHPS